MTTDPATEWQRTLLRETLQLAVPLRIKELRDATAGQLTAAAAAVGHGDDLLHGGPYCRQGFAELTRALAIAALLADGGVDYIGLHWCAIPYCRAGSRFDHVDDTDAELWPTEPPPRPVETLPDIAAWTG